MNILVLKHADCEGLGLWEGFCQEAGIAVEVLELHRGAPTPVPHRFQAVISLGGPINAAEEGAYSFLRSEVAFIQQVLTAGVPILGIALGGQLLAQAVGGLVTRSAVKEIGWHPITLNEIGRRDPLLAGLPETFTVFQWDGGTLQAPPGTVPLASSPAWGILAVRFGGLAYGLQFRLEVTPAMVGDLVREYGGELADRVDPARMLEEAPAQCERLRPLSRQVFDNFCTLVRLRAPKPESPAVDRHRRGEPRGSREDPKVERARQRYRELMSRGLLRCGVTCPLERIGRCTGGCW